ncbi:MAG: tail protein X [Burkholderiales bacterium]|nr:tail protein X [Burkholderiales bacterium]
MTAISNETYEVRAEGLTLSALIWARFKRPKIGLLERVLEMNVGLAEMGVIIPVGTKIIIPIDPPPTRSATVVDAIQLWD